MVLSVYPSSQFAARGVSGYLTKESAPEELVQAIRTAAAGRRHINPAVAEALACAENLTASQPAPPQTIAWLSRKLSKPHQEAPAQLTAVKDLTDSVRCLSELWKTNS
jgi:DNA-binding NarL/FixJ family response regulator